MHGNRPTWKHVVILTREGPRRSVWVVSRFNRYVVHEFKVLSTRKCDFHWEQVSFVLKHSKIVRQCKMRCNRRRFKGDKISASEILLLWPPYVHQVLDNRWIQFIRWFMMTKVSLPLYNQNSIHSFCCHSYGVYSIFAWAKLWCDLGIKLICPTHSRRSFPKAIYIFPPCVSILFVFYLLYRKSLVCNSL